MDICELKSNRTPEVALKDILSAKRLKFADFDQIEAIFVLRMAEELIETETECTECDGTGESEDDSPGECCKCGRECSYCEGMDCPTCDGNGIVKWNRNKVYKMKPREIWEALQRPHVEDMAA